MPLGTDGTGRESEVDAAQIPLTEIQVLCASHGRTAVKQALWRWASDDAAGTDMLEAVAANLHTGGSGYWSFSHWIEAAVKFGNTLSD